MIVSQNMVGLKKNLFTIHMFLSTESLSSSRTRNGSVDNVMVFNKRTIQSRPTRIFLTQNNMIMILLIALHK